MPHASTMDTNEFEAIRLDSSVPESTESSADFEQAEYRLHSALTDRLRAHMDVWVARHNPICLVGAVEGAHSRERAAAALMFCDAGDRGRLISYFELDLATQQRRGAFRFLWLDRLETVPPSEMHLIELAKAIAVSDPANADTRQMGSDHFYWLSQNGSSGGK
jgi:hypothetical protein